MQVIANLTIFFVSMWFHSYTGFVSRAFGEQVVMRIGAAWALLTSAFALVYMRVRTSNGGM